MKDRTPPKKLTWLPCCFPLSLINTHKCVCVCVSPPVRDLEEAAPKSENASRCLVRRCTAVGVVVVVVVTVGHSGRRRHHHSAGINHNSNKSSSSVVVVVGDCLCCGGRARAPATGGVARGSSSTPPSRSTAEPTAAATSAPAEEALAAAAVAVADAAAGDPNDALWRLLSSAPDVLGSLLIFAVIILVHESGHFFAAKSFGMAVEEFSVGVGPRLFGFDAGGSQFSVRAVPLGGYVKFPDIYNRTQAVAVDVVDRQAAEEFLRQRQPGLGMQLLNALTLGTLEDKLWREEKKKRREQQQQQPPATSDADAYDEVQYDDNPNLFQNRPWPERAVVLSGGVVFNMLLAFFLYFGQITVGTGLPMPTLDSTIFVNAAPTPGSAADGVLRRGDLIVRCDGVPVMALASPTAPESRAAIQRLVDTMRATPEGASLALTVIHPNSPSKVVDVSLQRQRHSLGDAEATPPVDFGLSLSPNYTTIDMVRTTNPMEAAKLAFQQTYSVTQETAAIFVSVVASSVTGSGEASSDENIGGPLEVIRLGTETVASKRWAFVAFFTAALSINAAVVNSFPFPNLDGGQLVFVFSEALTGRKVNQRLQERVTAVATLLLLYFIVSTFVGDLSHLVRR